MALKTLKIDSSLHFWSDGSDQFIHENIFTAEQVSEKTWNRSTQIIRQIINSVVSLLQHKWPYGDPHMSSWVK